MNGWRFDPRDPAFVRDPNPFLAWLREHEPVHRAPSGPWILTRWTDIRAALDDPRLGNAPARYAVVHRRNRDRYVCADVAANILPFLDPPEHALPRRVLGRAFHERLRRSPPDVRATAGELLRRWPPGEPRDVIADFATPLAVATICDMVGARCDAERLARWTELFFYLFGAIPSVEARDRLDAALLEFRSFLAEVLAERRAAPRDDVISALVAAGCTAGGGGDTDAQAPDERAALTDAQIVDNCMLLLADGVGNVDRAIGNAVHTLLAHPGELARLRAAPELLASAVDECLRFESPAQYIGRVARAPVEYGGVTIPEGATVLLVLGAANRDPSAFDEPDRFDVARAPNPHLAFGWGHHSCLGGPLVELQLRVALECLLELSPQIRPVPSEPRFVERPGHRWIERVPVVRG